MKPTAARARRIKLALGLLVGLAPGAARDLHAHPLCILTTQLSTTTPMAADGASVPYTLTFCETTKAFSAVVTDASLPVDPAVFVPGSGAWTSCPKTCSIDPDGTLRLAPFDVGPGVCVSFDLTLTLQPGHRKDVLCEQGSTIHQVLGGQFPCNQPTDDPTTTAVADPTCVGVKDSQPGCVVYAVSAPPISIGCAGTAVTLSASTSSQSGCPGTTLAYQWQKDGVMLPGDTGVDHVISASTPPSGANYRCLVSCAGLPECRRLSDPSLVVLQGPGALVAPDSACQGQPAAIAVTDGVTCSIDCGNGNPPTALCSTSCTYSTPGTYTVTADATDANFCELVQTHTIQVIGQVKACIGTLPDICEAPAQGPTTALLTNCSVLGTNSAWTTSFGTLSSASAREPSLSLPDVSVATPVTVTLTSSAASCGVPDLASATFTLLPAPQSAMTVSPDPGCAGSPVTFGAPASGSPGPFIWDWQFGDGQSSTLDAPTNIYAVKGTYLVTLNLRDSVDGCQTQLTHSLVVVQDCCATALPPMSGLKLVKAPNPVDITLTWDTMAGATDGYDVWECKDKRDIAISRAPGGSGLSEVCLRSPSTTCVLTGWVSLPGLRFYTGHGICGGSEGI